MPPTDRPPPTDDRRFVPTARLAWLLLVPLPLLLLMPGLRQGLLLAAGLDVGLILLAVVDAALAGRIRLDVSRRVAPRLSVGAPNPVRLELHERSGTAARVELRDHRPAAFEADAEQLEVRLAPYQRTEAVYRVTPPERGRYRFEELWLRVRGPLGLGRSERRLPLAEEVRVYPDLRSAGRLLLAGGARDLASMGIRTVRREGEGSEFEMLREYGGGDAYRDIDWKATARRDFPVVRVHEPERSQTVLLCVDAGRLMAVRAGRLTKLDHAVNAALLLAFVALRNDDRVGLLVFADGVQSWVPPAKGRAQYRRILEALYAVRPSLTYVDYRAFSRAVLARQPRRALVLTFTEIHDEAHSRPLVQQVRRLAGRHLPVVLALRDPALEATARALPEGPDDSWRMAVASELLEERSALQRGLAAAGARILDRSPDEATVAAVNAYVEIKRRQLL